MKVKFKKIPTVLLMSCSALLCYSMWLLLCPVKIVAVHEDGHFSSVLVKNFPFTDRGKIDWWLKNKDMLKSRYGIPKPASYGNFTIIFWDFSDGYKEEGKYDRLCFDDMKTKTNCIEKDAIFSIDRSQNMGTVFTVYNGGNYRLEKDGSIVKEKDE